MADSDFNIKAIISAETAKFEKGMKDAQKSVNNLSESINKGVSAWGLDLNKFYDKGDSLFKSFGVDIDKFASHFGVEGKFVAAIGVSVAALSKLGQAMDEATANIVKGTGATEKELKNLETSMQSALIKGVGRSAAEVGTVIADLNTRFGVTGKELTELTVQMDAFASVTGTDTKTAVNSVADVMAKWNIEAESMDDLMEQLTKASQMSGASVTQLTASLKQSQSTLAAFGMSVTDSISLLSVMSKNGINTESAMMGMHMALAKFSKEGLNAKDAFAEVAEKIKTTSNQTEALKLATETFGQRSGAEMVKVLRESAGMTEEFTKALENANGTIQKTDENSRTMKDALDDLKAVMVGSFGQFGQAISGALKDVIDVVRNVFSLISPIINAIGGVVRELVTGITGYISKVVYAFTDLSKRLTGDSNIIVSILNALKNAISAVFEAILWIFDKFYRGAVIAIDGVKIGFLNLKIAVAQIVNPIAEDLAKAFNKILQKIKDLGDKINEYLPEAFKLPKIELIDEKNAGIDVAKAKENISELKNEINKMLNGTQQSVIKTKDVVMDSVDVVEKKEKETTQKQTDWDKKLMEQKVASLEKTNKYSKELYNLKVQLINIERQEQLAVAKTSTEIKNINKFYDEQIKAIPAYASATQEGIHAIFDSYKKDAEDWSDVAQSTINIVGNSFGDMFTMMGENLAGAGNSYEDFSATAVEALSSVLKSLAAQLSATAALRAANYDYASAALAAAGAAAALVAAGTLSAVASNMKKTSDAAKEASSSLEEFKKRLAEIWSGATSTSGFVSSLVQMNNVIETTRANVEKAQKAYSDLYASQEDYVQKVWNTYFNGSLYGRWGNEIYEGFYKLKKSYGELTLELEKYKEALKTLEESRGKLIQQQDKSIETTRLEIKAYEDLYSSIFKLKGVSDDYTNVLNANVKILKNEIFSKLQEEVKSLYSSLINIGSDLGKSITDGIKNGVTKSDFMETVKEYIKNKVIELVVYTDEFNSQLAEIGTKLSSAIASGLPNEIAKATKQIEKLYESASNAAKKASDAIDEANKKISNSLSERLKKSIENIQETFKQKIEAIAQQAKEAAKKAEEELKAKYEEIGSSLGQILVNSLVNGAKKEDFSKELGNYFKNQLVQVVIYTQEFTEKMTAFGEKIYKALMSGNQISVIKLKSEIEKYFSTKQSEIKVMSDFINSLFGLEVKENISSGADTIVENVSKIQKAIDNLKDSVADLGGDVASNFISSLNSGLDLDSALISFKKFIRNYVIQSAVYTNSLKSEMEKIGQGIADYIMGKNGGLDKISNEFKKTYEKLAGNISKADEYLDKIFGKEKEKEVKDTGNTITKELSKIESAMDSFKKTVSDLGGDIASNLIEGLSSGLSQSDFLTNMKNWIKKMLVQSVVYTEQMKSQIEEIGKAISSAISGGFTETSMHEIRRDLSFIFEQATSKMSGIDKILGGVFDGYASGTTSALSGLHIVGERGPELIRFNGGERVYNNADTMRMIAGAGKTNNFNVTFNNLQDTSAFAMMSQLKQYNREMAINSIM